MAKKILIVDDSPTMLMSMQNILERAGHQVTKAACGEDAVRTLRTGLKPDLVITDYHMGAMDGIELVRQVRGMGHRFVPILLLTTESQQSKRTDAKAAGATGWLVKPVQPDALLGVIKQVVPGA